MLKQVKVKLDKKFQPHVPGQARALERMGRLAALKIRKRIEKGGRHAEGKLPVNKDRGYWWVAGADPRFKTTGALETRKKGALRVSHDGYRGFKQRFSGNRRQGQSLTGDMWSKLAVTVLDKGVGKKVIKIRFAGSSIVGVTPNPKKPGKMKKVRFQNRRKAWLLQFARRGPNKGGKAGTSQGRAMFTLMALTQEELDALRRLYMSQLRLFKSGSVTFESR